MVVKKKNVWKIVLSVFAILVILIIIGGAIKFLFFKESFIKTTNEQITSAKSLVSQALQAKGDNISNYNIKISEKIEQSDEKNESNTLQVFLSNNSTMHSYLIDLDSNMIVMHTEKEIYGWMLDKCKEHGDKKESNKENDKENNSESDFEEMNNFNFEECEN